ncbi:MAG: hypothetical protein HYZ53_01575 [Planctomycetes bacterium]|nr:hypothetical protein [Planctomycetota bacterium]
MDFMPADSRRATLLAFLALSFGLNLYLARTERLGAEAAATASPTPAADGDAARRSGKAVRSDAPPPQTTPTSPAADASRAALADQRSRLQDRGASLEKELADGRKRSRPAPG